VPWLTARAEEARAEANADRKVSETIVLSAAFQAGTRPKAQEEKNTHIPAAKAAPITVIFFIGYLVIIVYSIKNPKNRQSA
jgi:hypothetical protein